MLLIDILIIILRVNVFTPKDIVRSPILLMSEEGQDLLQTIVSCLKKMCGHLILSPKTDGRAG